MINYPVEAIIRYVDKVTLTIFILYYPKQDVVKALNLLSVIATISCLENVNID